MELPASLALPPLCCGQVHDQIVHNTLRSEGPGLRVLTIERGFSVSETFTDAGDRVQVATRPLSLPFNPNRCSTPVSNARYSTGQQLGPAARR